MQQEINGQYCEVCKHNLAMLEKYQGTWICSSCASNPDEGKSKKEGDENANTV